LEEWKDGNPGSRREILSFRYTEVMTAEDEKLLLQGTLEYEKKHNKGGLDIVLGPR
jgi:hypothetical protein